MDDRTIEAPDLPAIIESHLRKEREDWKKRGRLWASDLGIALGPEHDGCPAAFWHACRDAPKTEPTVGNLWMWKLGNIAEDVVLDILREEMPKRGWRVETQRRYERDGVSGRLDILLIHIATGTRYIFDVKTKRGAAFGFLNDAKPGNILQDQFYITADAEQVEKSGEGVTAGGGILYVDREGANFMRQFDCERADHRIDEATRRLKELRDGPEPETLTLKVTRKENKGDDSISIDIPWQVKWCSLQECPCAKAIGGTPPKGVVAHVTKTGIVKPKKDAYKKWLPLIIAELERQYPDEEFKEES